MKKAAVAKFKLQEKVDKRRQASRAKLDTGAALDAAAAVDDGTATRNSISLDDMSPRNRDAMAKELYTEMLMQKESRSPPRSQGLQQASTQQLRHSSSEAQDWYEEDLLAYRRDQVVGWSMDVLSGTIMNLAFMI